MTRHFFTFLGTFVAGALLALVARAAWFNPNAAHTGHTAGGGDYAPMVANTGAPTGDAQAAPGAPPAASGHDHASGPSAAMKPVATVNTLCSICGMEVDPELPTANYQGQTIGFGCKTCPAKFQANPDKYGPAALRNEVVKN